jgi:hypothetical protein
VCTYIFNLQDIYKYDSSYYSGSKSIFLKTYEDQRLITVVKNNINYITPQVIIYMDGIVSDERISKAWDYAILLAGGGKKILKEKF